MDEYSSVGMMNTEATYQGPAPDPRTETGWFSSLTGGQAEKRANVAQADFDFARTTAYNSAEAQKQRDFEERLSNTAYSRAVADMKRAGLNPALMYAKGGMSANTPSGNSASSSGRATNQTPSATGQLAGLIAGVAFASAKTVALAKTGMSKASILKSHGIRV